MTNPLISIIVPVYNVEAYIDECLHSIRNQTYSNLEIIVVDDGSTDGSLQRIREHAAQDSRIVLIQQPNGGQSAARNNGLRHMHGELVMFADSDDVMEHDAVAFLLDKMTESQVDIVVGHHTVLMPDGSLLPIDGHRDDYFEIKMDSHKEMMLRLMAVSEGLNIVAQLTVVWGNLYKRKVVENIWFPENRYYEDHHVDYRYFLNADSILYANKIVSLYRRRENSTTQGGIPAVRLLEDVAHAIWERIEIFHRIGLDLSPQVDITMFFHNLCLMPLLQCPDFAQLPDETRGFYRGLKDIIDMSQPHK